MLRTRHGFPRGKNPFGVECVLSRERVVYPRKDGPVCATPGTDQDLRIDCDTGFGTASFVTGTFGFVAASRIIQRITGTVGDCASPEQQMDPVQRSGNQGCNTD